MATWREIERIREDADAARLVARSLLLLVRSDPKAFSDWEIDFLESIAARIQVGEFSTRQAEKLLEIQDDVKRVTVVRDGSSVSLLIRGCFEARLDLSEDDEDWISELYENDRNSIRRKQIGRLMRCAADVGLVERYEVG